MVSGTSALITIFSLLSVIVDEWVLYFPFAVLCILLILSPWVVHSTFVLDSNYWRGLPRPSRLRGFGSVLIRLCSHSPTIPENCLDLSHREDTDLFADLLSDSLVSKPLQVFLRHALNMSICYRKCSKRRETVWWTLHSSRLRTLCWGMAPSLRWQSNRK